MERGVKKLQGFIDCLFITLSKQLVIINDNGLFATDNLTTGNEVVDDFLKLALNLSRDGYHPDIIEAELSFNISKSILNGNIDEITLHSLEIIKKTLRAIVSGDHLFLEWYSKCLCSDSAIREIQDDIFDIFNTVDIKNINVESLKDTYDNKNSISDIIPRSNKAKK